MASSSNRRYFIYIEDLLFSVAVMESKLALHLGPLQDNDGREIALPWEWLLAQIGCPVGS